MTELGARMMDEGDGRSGLKRMAMIAAVCLLVMVLLGLIGGTAAVMSEHNVKVATPVVAVLALIGALDAGALFYLLRALKTGADAEPPTAKERLNRNILIGSGLLGGVIGVVMVVADGSNAVFSTGPIAPIVAIALVIVIGGLLPYISYYWHTRAVDEQEAEAYKLGALGGIYVYMIGAPCWWFLWRGGLVPEPDGVAIYLITIFTVGVIWLWRKYR